MKSEENETNQRGGISEKKKHGSGAAAHGERRRRMKSSNGLEISENQKMWRNEHAGSNLAAAKNQHQKKRHKQHQQLWQWRHRQQWHSEISGKSGGIEAKKKKKKYRQQRGEVALALAWRKRSAGENDIETAKSGVENESGGSLA